MNPWRITGWACAAVIVGSVIACIVMAISRSDGLVSVTVTAIDPAKEPTDHNIPLVNQREARPDYELSLIGDNGDARYLGIKPDQSAAAGLTWHIDDPVSVTQIAAIRLQEKDVVMSDALAEVQLGQPIVESNGYRFEFATQRSFSVGVRTFFATPIGIAIASGFFIAVLVLILANFCG